MSAAGLVTVLLAVVCALLGIWTGDGRWLQTSAVFACVSFLLAFVAAAFYSDDL